MIKKYNQFVEEKVNEELIGSNPLIAGEPRPQTAPSAPSREVETVPGTPRPSTRPRPSRPSVVPGKRPSEEDAPLAEFDMEDEQVDIYTSKLIELALALGLDESAVKDNKIEFEGKTIIFPSETEKYHVDRKKFDTVDQVVAYLTGNIEKPTLNDQTVDPEFEAKSYKFSRRNRLK